MSFKGDSGSSSSDGEETLVKAAKAVAVSLHGDEEEVAEEMGAFGSSAAPVVGLLSRKEGKKKATAMTTRSFVDPARGGGASAALAPSPRLEDDDGSRKYQQDAPFGAEAAEDEEEQGRRQLGRWSTTSWRTARAKARLAALECAGTFACVFVQISAATQMPAIGAIGVVAAFGLAQYVGTAAFGADCNPIFLLAKVLFRWHRDGTDESFGYAMGLVVVALQFASAMLAGVAAKWCCFLDVSTAIPDVNSMIAIHDVHGNNVGLPFGSAMAIILFTSAIATAAVMMPRFGDPSSSRAMHHHATHNAMVVAAAAVASIAYTGACINPAYHLAVNANAVQFQPFRETCYVYYVFPVTGSLVGGLFATVFGRRQAHGSTQQQQQRGQVKYA
jgi:hypothetical protein